MDGAGYVLQRQPLLATKLHVPVRRSRQVARPRLSERLDQGLSRKLTLVSAPPGFGKTTAVGEWIPHSPYCVTWLSLDEGDNDPVRFWTYVIAALQRLDAGLGQQALSWLQSPQPISTEAVLTALVNEIDAFPHPFVLVLDDYHVIEAEAIHQALTFLLDHLPARMHLFIASRADPPFPLAHLRARSELTELRAADLRFTAEEASDYLNQRMGLNLSAQDVEALQVRTEGWAAGLQLAALSVRGREDLTGFVTAFTGSHRFIVDYLTEQVMQRQPASIQTFLLHTSILSRMNASLCDALLGWEGSQATLEMLDQHNLFVVPLDDERRWYRYHRLFADVLHYLLRATQPAIIPELHRRARAWFEGEGLLAEAVSHALAAGEFERAAQLIEASAESLAQRGEIRTLSRWIAALPNHILRGQPALCLAYARALSDTGQYAAAETFVSAAMHALERTLPPDASTAASLHGRAAAVRAHIAITRSEVAQAIELSHRAQQLLAPEDISWRGFAALSLAGAYRFSSNWAAASQAYLEASALSRSAGHTLSALAALSLRGEVVQAQGHLRQAAEQYEQIVGLARTWGVPQGPILGLALVGLGRVWYEWNDLEAAVRYTQDGLERGRQADSLDILLRGYLALARIRQAQGDLAGAGAALQDAEPVVRRMGVAGVKDWVSALRAHLDLVRGDIEAAVHWADAVEGGVDDAVYPAIAITLARVRLAQARPDTALALLDHALHAAQAVGRLGNAIQILVVKAVAHRAQGNPEQALVDLGQALAWAEPDGYVRVFVDEGPPMARLLRRMAARNPGSSYIRHLLEALGEFTPTAPTPTRRMEALSARELEVLQMIADGATNQEIADELVLTVNTVKKHVSNIFGKLGVDNRTQAIAQARKLGLF